MHKIKRYIIYICFDDTSIKERTVMRYGYSKLILIKRGQSDNFWTKTIVREERPVSFSDRQTGSCRWPRIDSASR